MRAHLLTEGKHICHLINAMWATKELEIIELCIVWIVEYFSIFFLKILETFDIHFHQWV
jgi:hypothetical protein